MPGIPGRMQLHIAAVYRPNDVTTDIVNAAFLFLCIGTAGKNDYSASITCIKGKTGIHAKVAAGVIVHGSALDNAIGGKIAKTASFFAGLVLNFKDFVDAFRREKLIAVFILSVVQQHAKQLGIIHCADSEVPLINMMCLSQFFVTCFVELTLHRIRDLPFGIIKAGNGVGILYPGCEKGAAHADWFENLVFGVGIERLI